MEETSSTPLTTSEFVSIAAIEIHSDNILFKSQDESSELFVGEWAETRGIRDELFIATKVHSWFFFSKVPLSDRIPVHYEFQAPRPRCQSESNVHREQFQVASPFDRGIAQKIAYHIY